MRMVYCSVLSSISRYDTENLLIKPSECTLPVINTTYILYYIICITFILYSGIVL
jgi:hypothetical protein